MSDPQFRHPICGMVESRLRDGSHRLAQQSAVFLMFCGSLAERRLGMTDAIASMAF
jgi:hypothetical protein